MPEEKGCNILNMGWKQAMDKASEKLIYCIRL